MPIAVLSICVCVCVLPMSSETTWQIELIFGVMIDIKPTGDLGQLSWPQVKGQGYQWGQGHQDLFGKCEKFDNLQKSSFSRNPSRNIRLAIFFSSLIFFFFRKFLSWVTISYSHLGDTLKLVFSENGYLMTNTWFFL